MIVRRATARVTLIAHLRRQLRVLRRGLANEAGFPDVVGERLFAVDVLALRQGQIGGKCVRVLGRRDDDSVEGAGLVEDAAEVDGLRSLRETLGRSVNGDLIDVTKNDHILVRMRRGRGSGVAATACARRGGAWRANRELVDVREASPATADEGDIQLVAEVPAAQQRRRAGDNPCGRQAADELTASDPAWAPVLDRLLHGIAPCRRDLSRTLWAVGRTDCAYSRRASKLPQERTFRPIPSPGRSTLSGPSVWLVPIRGRICRKVRNFWASAPDSRAEPGRRLELNRRVRRRRRTTRWPIMRGSDALVRQRPV